MGILNGIFKSRDKPQNEPIDKNKKFDKKYRRHAACRCFSWFRTVNCQCCGSTGSLQVAKRLNKTAFNAILKEILYRGTV